MSWGKNSDNDLLESSLTEKQGQLSEKRMRARAVSGVVPEEYSGVEKNMVKGMGIASLDGWQLVCRVLLWPPWPRLWLLHTVIQLVTLIWVSFHEPCLGTPHVWGPPMFAVPRV